ncbi:HTH domain-containing protein [Lactobacillus intestinalis]|uniref:HTH domain-containing protein n=1 Tax=Lactobacillus intestinalis TaxID=151781 RepID=UPI0026F19DF2|nr:HTH domain-containing protein [Lactobacillus intestinalis]
MAKIQMTLNINGVLFPNQRVKLSEFEAKVYKLIPVGKENAVSLAYLAKTLNVDTRTIVSAVRKMRLKSLDIGSGRDVGYYRFKDPQEYLEYMNRVAKENSERDRIYQAMKRTPMAQKVTVVTNNLKENKHEEISN